MELQPGFREEHRLLLPGGFVRRLDRKRRLQLVWTRSDDKWVSFQVAYQNTQNFAAAHGKPWMAVEYGSMEDPAVPGRKAQWFTDALPTIKSWPLLKALIYFDEVKDGYSWITDSSPSSIASYAQIGADAHLNP